MGNIIITQEKRDSDFIHKIKRITAAHHHISVEQLDMRTRKREIVNARQQAMYFAIVYTDASLAKIGQDIGSKDHATVLHAKKTVANLCDTDRAYRGRLYTLMEKIEAAANIHGICENDMVCIDCGSSKVQCTAWVNPNTGVVVDATKGNFNDPKLNWCMTCHANTQLITRAEYDHRRQENATVEDEPKPQKTEEEQRSEDQIFFEKKLDEIREEFDT